LDLCLDQINCFSIYLECCLSIILQNNSCHSKLETKIALTLLCFSNNKFGINGRGEIAHFATLHLVSIGKITHTNTNLIFVQRNNQLDTAVLNNSSASKPSLIDRKVIHHCILKVENRWTGICCWCRHIGEKHSIYFCIKVF